MKRIIIFLLFFTMLFGIIGCGESGDIKPVNDTQAVSEENTPEEQPTVPKDENTDLKNPVVIDNENTPTLEIPLYEGENFFTTEIFKLLALEKDDNILISPLSIELALAMTANGADNETKAAFEALYKSSIDEINNKYKDYAGFGIENKFSIANSIWYDTKDTILPREDFLNKNKDVYNAEIAGLDFSLPGTLETINGWVGNKTFSMIDKIIEDIKEEDVMYLINAIAFKLEWAKKYALEDVITEEFTKSDKTVITADYLFDSDSAGNLYYIKDSEAVGFIKDYEKTGDKQFSFAAILPNENISLNDYIEGLTDEKTEKLLSSKILSSSELKVNTKLPKFEYDYSKSLKDTLTGLGLQNAFSSSADFGKMFDLEDKAVNVEITDVMHKTHIKVNETGTEAAAVTSVTMSTTSMPIEEPEIAEVYLNRPFIYLIIEKESNDIVFMGTLRYPD